MRFAAHRHQAPEAVLSGYLDEARAMFSRADRPKAEALDRGLVGPDFEALRWFWLPEEIGAEIAGGRGADKAEISGA